MLLLPLGFVGLGLLALRRKPLPFSLGASDSRVRFDISTFPKDVQADVRKDWPKIESGVTTAQSVVILKELRMHKGVARLFDQKGKPRGVFTFYGKDPRDLQAVTIKHVRKLLQGENQNSACHFAMRFLEQQRIHGMRFTPAQAESISLMVRRSPACQTYIDKEHARALARELWISPTPREIKAWK